MPAADRLASRVTAGTVAVISGTMLAAWIAGLDLATRTDNLEPMSPLACVGFLVGAAGVFALSARPIRHAEAITAGAITLLVGVSGFVDSTINGGEAIN